jgi:exonuclease SbcC
MARVESELCAFGETIAAPTVADIVAALLPAEEVQALRGKRTDIMARESQLQARIAELLQSLEQCNESKPVRVEILADPVSRPTILASAENEYREASQAYYERESKLRENEERLGQAQALASELADREREAAVWQRLHDLIGIRDGDVFKRFAQSLNLRELLQRANGRLAFLAPRYRLEMPTGAAESRLTFSICDAYQPLATRPITTLSGGETFLVALSLSLALADWRTSRLPMETLLLDEGFGTLDESTLRLALQALQKLCESGTQVGIVSHVSELREYIGTRVVVERVRPGSSRLRIEIDNAPVKRTE